MSLSILQRRRTGEEKDSRNQVSFDAAAAARPGAVSGVLRLPVTASVRGQRTGIIVFDLQTHARSVTENRQTMAARVCRAAVPNNLAHAAATGVCDSLSARGPVSRSVCVEMDRMGPAVRSTRSARAGAVSCGTEVRVLWERPGQDTGESARDRTPVLGMRIRFLFRVSSRIGLLSDVLEEGVCGVWM